MVTQIKKSYDLADEINDWLDACKLADATQRAKIVAEGIQLNGHGDAVILVGATAQEVWDAVQAVGKADSRWVKTGYGEVKYHLGFTASKGGTIPVRGPQTTTEHGTPNPVTVAPKVGKIASRKAYEKFAAAWAELGAGFRADGIAIVVNLDLAWIDAEIKAVEEVKEAAAKLAAEQAAAELAAKRATDKAAADKAKLEKQVAEMTAKLAELTAKLGK